MRINDFLPILDRSVAKYKFYEGTFDYPDYENSGIARKLPKSRVGWARRAVDMRANKTRFDRFENDRIGLNEVFASFHGPEAFEKIKSDVLVAGVGFLALAGDRVMPFTALEATGTYDWREQNLGDGLAVFRRETKKSNPRLGKFADSYMEFHREKTVTCERGVTTEVENPVGRPLIGMLTYRATAKKPFGASVISRPARDAIIDASRTVRQATIAAYHYNSKVDVILGADVETEIDKIQATTGDIIKIGSNENGQIPQIGQFAQHALAPFNDSITMFAKNFCSDTKLNLANLGIAANAPQSPEALEIVGDDLRDDIEAWQSELGEQLKYFAVTLFMEKNDLREIDENLQKAIDEITVAWKPIFRPDVSKFGDGLNKIAANAPAIVYQRSIWRSLGLSSAEIDKLLAAQGETSAI